MIYGNESKATIIAARAMPGYDAFTDDNFIKSFQGGETLEVFYPPDHPNSGSKYLFDSSLGSTVVGVVTNLHDRNGVFPEKQSTFNSDIPYPYQDELEIQFTPTTNSGIRPLTDRGVTADNGVDAFLLKGSIIRGTISGAKRFYAGPFKGFTKEIEGVCQGATSVNLMDGSDCAGYLKGSFYEHGFDPAVHNLFKYSDQTQTKVDVNGPMNHYFMDNTPYSNLAYTWINVRDRFKRPVPYSMVSNSGNGESAVLITSRHALVSADADIDAANLRFYSGLSGIVTPTVLTTASTFKQMWDAIGFIDENRDAETLAAFNSLKQHFDDIKIITFTEDLPDDVRRIRLIDIGNSDPIFYGLAIGSDGRGHAGTFCPPITYKLLDDPSDSPSLLFKESQKCGTMGSQNKHEMPFIPRTVSVVTTDIGSPVITYYRGTPLLIGMMSAGGHDGGTAYAKIVGTGLGSTKEVAFPWGASFSPVSFLNMYTSINAPSTNYLESVALARRSSDTINTYPYPEIPFEEGDAIARDGIAMRMFRGGTEVINGDKVDDRPEEIVKKLEECLKVAYQIIQCITDAIERKICECERYVKDKDYIQAFFCGSDLCSMTKRWVRELTGLRLTFDCPLNPNDPDISLKWKNIMFSAIGLLAVASGNPCNFVYAYNDGIVTDCNKIKSGKCLDSRGNTVPPKNPTPAISNECLILLGAGCGLQRLPNDPFTEMLLQAIACMISKQIDNPHPADGWVKEAYADCIRRNCPSGGIHTPKCDISCEDLYRMFRYGTIPPNCPEVPTNQPTPPNTEESTQGPPILG